MGYIRLVKVFSMFAIWFCFWNVTLMSLTSDFIALSCQLCGGCFLDGKSGSKLFQHISLEPQHSLPHDPQSSSPSALNHFISSAPQPLSHWSWPLYARKARVVIDLISPIVEIWVSFINNFFFLEALLIKGQVEWHILVILACCRIRQEDLEFQASLWHIVRLCQQTTARGKALLTYF